jgi:hypothetical protein
MTVTLLYAGLLGLMLLALLWPIVRLRRGRQVGLGDGGDPDLARAIRVHANFIEYVPIALILMMMLELRGMPVWWLHGAGVALVVARILHAVGLGSSAGYSFGRFWGTLLTWIVIFALSVAALSLGVVGVLR